MKNLIIFLLTISVIAGCSTEGDIKIINRTNHYLYFTIEGSDYILEGSENTNPNITIDVDTGKRFLFFGEGETQVDMFMEGETFMMQEADSYGNPTGYYYTETTLTVKSNETLKIYCDPTHAGVKLINNSLVDVVEFCYYTDDNDSLVLIIDYLVVPGDSAWSRLKASTALDSIIYSFIIEYETGDIDSSYVDIDNLVVDEQFPIELP